MLRTPASEETGRNSRPVGQRRTRSRNQPSTQQHRAAPGAALPDAVYRVRRRTRHCGHPAAAHDRERRSAARAAGRLRLAVGQRRDVQTGVAGAAVCQLRASVRDREGRRCRRSPGRVVPVSVDSQQRNQERGRDHRAGARSIGVCSVAVDRREPCPREWHRRRGSGRRAGRAVRLRHRVRTVAHRRCRARVSRQVRIHPSVERDDQGRRVRGLRRLSGEQSRGRVPSLGREHRAAAGERHRRRRHDPRRRLRRRKHLRRNRARGVPRRLPSDRGRSRHRHPQQPLLRLPDKRHPGTSPSEARSKPTGWSRTTSSARRPAATRSFSHRRHRAACARASSSGTT